MEISNLVPLVEMETSGNITYIYLDTSRNDKKKVRSKLVLLVEMEN